MVTPRGEELYQCCSSVGQTTCVAAGSSTTTAYSMEVACQHYENSCH